MALSLSPSDGAVSVGNRTKSSNKGFDRLSFSSPPPLLRKGGKCQSLAPSKQASSNPRRLSVQALASRAREYWQDTWTPSCSMHTLTLISEHKVCKMKWKHHRASEKYLSLVLPAASTSQRHHTKPASRTAKQDHEVALGQSQKILKSTGPSCKFASLSPRRLTLRLRWNGLQLRLQCRLEETSASSCSSCRSRSLPAII